MYRDIEWGGTPFYHMTDTEKRTAMLRDEAELRRIQGWKESRHERPTYEREIDLADTLKALAGELASIRIELQRQAKEIAFLKKSRITPEMPPTYQLPKNNTFEVS